MSIYAKGSNGKTIWMLCLIKNHKLLKKKNYICNKFSNSIKKELDSKPIYHKKFQKPKSNLTVIRIHIFMIKKCLK